MQGIPGIDSGGNGDLGPELDPKVLEVYTAVGKVNEGIIIHRIVCKVVLLFDCKLGTQ